ncbi:MAG TPA: hypothetical protein VJQ77_09355 [Novosphingobium sp.]|nr:hypothetical protein [Novosphingobium sp.]
MPCASPICGTREYIPYHVIATTRNYYRDRFGLSAEDTVAAARLAIEQAITGGDRGQRA